VNEHALFELAGKGFDFAFFELHHTVDEREESIVSTTLDVVTGMILRTTLPDDDIAFHRDLVAIDFHAEALRD